MTTLVGGTYGAFLSPRRLLSAFSFFVIISTGLLLPILTVFAIPDDGNGGIFITPPDSGGPGSGDPGAGGNGVPGTGSGTDTDPGAGINPNTPLPVDPGLAAAAAKAQATPVVVTGEIQDPILYVLHAIVISGLGWVVGMFGYLFDFSVNTFIIGFGDQFINYNVGVTVEALWSTVRDIFNLTFIFGLIYIGFKMILDSSDSSARKMLISLVGAALLVNFSLFITKFVVDFSNIAAFQVYKAFSGSAADGSYSITEGFMNLMGINSIMGVTYVESGAGGYQYIIGTLIVFLVLAYVFLAGAIMIIIRFAVLTIYMIFSPMMFLGWVFPAMKGYSSKYWSGFLGQAFFAPAFIFMLYLSYRVADSYNFSKKSFEHLFNPGGTLTDTVGGIDPTIPYFAMVIVFLVASIVVAKNIGGTSAKMGIAFADKLRGNTQSYIGRNTVGRPASWMAKNQDTKGGRVASNFLTVASLGTFNNRAQRDLYEKGKKAKFGGSYSRSDDKDYAEKRSSLESSANTKASNKGAIAAGKAALKVPEEQRTDAHKDAIYKMQSVVAGMSISEIEAMGDKDRTSIASAFTAAQAESLMKSDKIGNDDKIAIGKARKEAIEKLVTKNEQLISSELTKLTIEQIEDAGADFIRKYAGIFSAAQVEDLKKSKKLSPSLKTNFTSERTKFLNEAIGDKSKASTVFNTFTGKTGKDAYKRRKATDVAGLGRDVLLSDNALEHLTIGDLEAIGDKKTLEREDRDILKGKIEMAAQGGSANAKNLRAWLNGPQGIRLNW